MNTRNSPGNKVQVGTIDCTPTWESLVPWMLSVLTDDDAKPESKKIIREQITRMAQVADKHVAYIKSQEVNSSNLMEKILEIAKPKFCGDTSIVLNSRAKLSGFTDDKAYLNGLIGVCRHPIPGEQSTTGLVGFYITPGQKKQFSMDKLNVEEKHIQFLL